MLPKGWIVLTRLGAEPGQSAQPIAIQVAQIIFVRSGDQDDPDGAKSVLDFPDGKTQAVAEPIETVLQMISDNPAPSS
jgi:hypothetical protein